VRDARHPKYNGLCLKSRPTIHKRADDAEDDLYNDWRALSGVPFRRRRLTRRWGKLFEALAANRISPKRAATLAYIAYLLLQADAGLKAETRLTELQGAKDLHMLLKMRYGPALRKEAESVWRKCNQEKS